jgi:hypothetical protein
LQLPKAIIFRNDTRGLRLCPSRGKLMPNYSKLEQDLLSNRLAKLVRASRAPELAALDDAALYRTITEIKAEAGKTTAASQGAAPGLFEILQAASRRLTTERRKRKLPAEPAAVTPPPPPAPKAATKAGKRAPASPARKPAGRKKSETRKADLRTGSRRIAKGKIPAAIAAPVAVVSGAETLPSAMDLADTETAAVALDTGIDKARQKALKKAAKEAEKAARKSRKAAEKAAKQAQKDAQKSARKAEKAARKLDEKAATLTKAKSAKKAESDLAKVGKKTKRAKKAKTGKKADTAAEQG